MARQFGIITTTTEISDIVVTGLKTGTSIEKAEARDSSGKVTDIAAYSKQKNVSINGLLDTNTSGGSGTSLPEAGSTVTFGGISYVLDSVEQNETNTGFVDVSLTGSTADSATIIVYPVSSGSSGNL